MAITTDELYGVLFVNNSMPPGALCEVSRQAVSAAWSAPRTISPLANQKGPKSPSLSGDGLTLVFTRARTATDYPGKSGEFVVCRRTARDQPWSVPQVVPMARNSLITDAVTWPHLSDDELTLVFCHGGDRLPEVFFAFRNKRDGDFDRYTPVKLEGQMLKGASPRWVASRGEIYLDRSRVAGGAAAVADADLFLATGLTTPAGK
jgi:hypothetical protein